MATMSAPADATTSTSTSRPTTVTLAVILRVVAVIAGVLTPLLPRGDEMAGAAIVITTVLSLVMLVGAWGLWNLRRWGAILTFVLTTLSVLSAIPASTEISGAWLIAALLILTPIEIVILVLIALPSSRRAYR